MTQIAKRSYGRFFASRRAKTGLTSGLALGLVLSTAVWAQSYSFSSVSVSGNSRVETSTILAYAGISRGETVDAARLNDAAQAIRDTGLFESVDVRVAGSTLVIDVIERPMIGIVNFEGNSAVKDDTLAGLVQSASRTPFDAARAQRDAQTVAEFYASRGRVNAVVTPQLIRRDANRVDLVFQVAEGGVSEVERISFVGNRRFSDRRLRGVLGTKQAGILRGLIGRDVYNADRIGFDRQVLTDFYRSRGYVDAQVTDVDVALSPERDATMITFNVVEGQQFNIGGVSVSSEMNGVDPAPYNRVVRLRRGQVYSPSRIEGDIRRIEELATDRGVDFLRVDPRITRDARGLVLDVNYVLVRGERIFIERIDIEGNTTTLDRVVRSQFTSAEGDPFNPRQIRRSAERIRALGYFADAQIDAVPGSRPDTVVIDVDVVEKPTGTLTFGANYSSDFGVGFLANFKERNFMGRGQTLNFDLTVGKSNRQFSFDFVEPRLLSRDLAFGLSASYGTTNNQAALYDTVSGKLRPSLAFPVSDNGRLQVYYDFNYTDIKDVNGSASQVIKSEAALGGIATHALGYRYTWDTLRSGSSEDQWRLRLSFGQEYGGNADTRFLRTSGSISAQTRVFHDDITLRGTIEGGMLHYTDGSSRVTDRYFMGSQVMRGFQPGGIGPRDAVTGDALGGNKYAVARLEAQFPLGLPEEYGITGGMFVDYGSVWDVGNLQGQAVDYNEFTPRAVAGLSLFWTTPLGPLRFNYSKPLQVEAKDLTRSFDVTISTEF